MPIPASPSVTDIIHGVRHPGGCRTTGAFTLVEVLVVLAILGTLISLSLPVIGIILKAAEQANCQSNQRQIGLALFVYAGEHRGSLPLPHNRPGSLAYASYDNLLAPYEDRSLPSPYTLPEAVNPSQVRAWNQYRCPSEKDILSNRTWLEDSAGGVRFYRSYGMNGAYTGLESLNTFLLRGLLRSAPSIPGGVGESVRMMAIRQPGQTILLAETRYTANCYLGGRGGEVVSCLSNQIDSRNSTEPLHRGRWNYTMADGRVSLLKAEDTIAPGTSHNSTVDGSMWWR